MVPGRTAIGSGGGCQQRRNGSGLLAAVIDDGNLVLCMDGGTTLPGGHVLWSYPADVYAVGVLPDVNADGIDEAIAVLWVSDGSAIRCLDGATGGLLWSSTTVPGSVMSSSGRSRPSLLGTPAGRRQRRT